MKKGARQTRSRSEPGDSRPEPREAPGQTKSPKASWILWIVPAAALILSLLAVSARGPYYRAHNFDPEYCYLLNAVNLLTLQAPAHTDHPGTTLQELTAAVCLARWLASGVTGPWEPLDRAVLRRPELYLHTVNLVLNLLFFGTLFWAGRRIVSASGSVAVALVFQASFLLFDEILLAQTRVSPEPLLTITFLMLTGVMAPFIARPETAETNGGFRGVMLAGAVTGFGIVTKVTFLPLLLLGFAFRGRRLRLGFFFGVVTAAAVFLLPIYGQLPRVARWLWGLLTHKGRYGSGETGLPSIAVLLDNAGRLYGEEPFLFFMGAFFLVAVILTWRRSSSDSYVGAAGHARRFLVAGLAGIALSVALTVKHYASHYALPAMLLVTLLGAIFAGLALQRSRTSRLWQAGGLLFALLLTAGLGYSLQRIPKWFFALEQQNAEEARLREILASFEGCTVAGVYRSSLPVFALNFGNNFAAWRQQRVLSELYPGAVHYHDFVHRFQDFAFRNQNERVARLIESGECVLVVGERSAVEAVPGFRQEFVGEAGDQIVVRLTGVERPDNETR